MLRKSELMKHKRMWAVLRMIDRSHTAHKADKSHYIKYKKGAFEYRSKYSDLADTIKQEAVSLSNTDDISNCSAVLIENEDLVMLSNNGDQMGKVFLYKGEIYRGIYEDRVAEFMEIWRTGVLQSLWNNNIIPRIQLTNYQTKEFPLIIWIEKVQIQRNINWTFAMIREACCMLIMLHEVLKCFGCTLLDGHLNNITFNHGKPMFVDIGSIIVDRPTAVCEELVFCGLFRLLFGSLGNTMLYRMPVFDMSSGTAFVEPRYYNQMTREYRYCRRIFIRFLLLSGRLSLVIRAIKSFYLYDISIDDTEALFPIYIENKESIKDDLIFGEDFGINFNDSTVTDIGGGYEILSTIEKEYCLKSIHYMDYDEKRLDRTFLKYIENKKNVKFSLMNYIYLQKDEHLQEYQSDIVFCVLPFENSRSYQGLNSSTIAAQLNLIGLKNIVLILNEDEFENNSKLLEELNYFYLMEKMMKINGLIVWKGRRC